MLANVTSEGLEFIRAWDRNKVSIIALIPFAVSLLFAIIWIVVSIARYAVDAQVAVQTAFTVAGFIVTAGKSKCWKSEDDKVYNLTQTQALF